MESCQVQNGSCMFSKILIFICQFKSYHSQQILPGLFLIWQTHFVHFQENVCQTPNSEEPQFVCQLFFSGTNSVPFKNWLVQPAPHLTSACLDTSPISVGRLGLFASSYCIPTEHFSQRLTFNNKINNVFIASSRTFSNVTAFCFFLF